MSQLRLGVRGNLLWLLLMLGMSIGLCSSAVFAADTASSPVTIETGAQKKVFAIDKTGNLMVKGKISQNLGTINITSSTENWELNDNAARRFLLQINEKNSGNALGNFYLAGSLNSVTTNPQAIDFISYLCDNWGSPSAVFKKNGDLILSGRAYEYVSNPDTFVPDAGAVQFQFSKYETENTTGACAVVNVIRTGEKSANISVQYRTLDDTALSGVHYQSASGTLNFAVSDSVSSFTVPILYNESSTSSKSLVLELFNPGGGCRLGLISRVQVVINALPPDPRAVSPVLAVNADPDFRELTRFLYQSSDYAPLIQLGMTSGTIRADQASVIRGTVYQANIDTSATLPGVRVSILDHPEYGYTFSRTDGLYDLVVNGGGPLTIVFEKAGYLRSQRKITPTPQDFTRAPVVALIKPSTEYYFADLLNNNQYIPIRLKPVTDADGTRQGLILFQPNTKAQMIYPTNADGTTSPSVSINTFNFYVNEFTVGKLGPAAMPADLDPQVEYTYCAEFSVLEAEAAGAKMVRFDKPAIHYLNNFMGFPVGLNIPSGSYYRDSVTIPDSALGTLPGGRWIPEQNGRVIKILREDQVSTRPIAVVDAMGTGEPTPLADLAAFGITEDELYVLAAQYNPGDELWRVPVEHFTFPHDWNWGKVFERVADFFKLIFDFLSRLFWRFLDWIKGWGSISTLEQTLHESISITGTPYSLNYIGERAKGYLLGGDDKFTLQLLPDQTTVLPTSITCELHYAGKLFATTFNHPTTHGFKVTLSTDDIASSSTADHSSGRGTDWVFTPVSAVNFRSSSTLQTPPEKKDDCDIYGYQIKKYRKARLRVGYTFPVVYALSQSSFDRYVEQYGNIFALFADPEPDGERALAVSAALRGTTSTPETIRYYDLVAGVFLARSRRQTETYWIEREVDIPPIDPSVNKAYARIKSIGNWSFNVHHSYDNVKKMVYQGDGERYQAENGYLISRNLGDLRGMAVHQPPFSNSRGAYLRGMDLGPDGSLYVADGLRVYKIKSLDDEHRDVSVFAGSGAENESGDGGDPLNAGLVNAQDVAVVSDDLVYIAQSFQIRKVEHNRISTVAFSRNAPYYFGNLLTQGGNCRQYDGKPASEITFGGYIQKIAVGPDGSLYVLANLEHQTQVVRVDNAGRFYFIAGSSGDPNQENIFAVKAPCSSQDLDVGPDGTIYLIEPTRIRKIDASGKIATIAGNDGATIVDPDGSPATSTKISNGKAIKVTRDGYIYYLEAGFGSPTPYSSKIRVCVIDPAGRAYTLAGSKARGDYSGDGGPALRSGLGTDPRGLAVTNDGTIYVSESNISSKTNLFRCKSPLPVFSVTDIVIPSQDGRLLYKFDQQGVHQETWNAATGEKLLTFNYGMGGELLTLVDAFGTTTTIRRHAYSTDMTDDPRYPKNRKAKVSYAAILEAPNGQSTDVRLDDQGNMSRLTKPGGATFTMLYKDDLLTTITGPRNDRYTFEYDSLGLMTKATDPLDGGLSLKRLTNIDQSTGMGVETVSAMGVSTTTTLVEDSSKNVTRTWLSPDGTKTTLLKRPDATFTLKSPDGTVIDLEESPDPRCWMTAPYYSRIAVDTAGINSLTSHTRSVSMPDRNKPFDYSQTDRISNDGLTTSFTLRRANAAGEREIVSRSPQGITATARIDRYGRPLKVTPPGGFYARSSSYYDAPAMAKGKLHEAWQGSGAEERRVSMAYNALGLPATLTDPIGRTLSLEYDSANNLTTQTLPDGRKVVLGYDESGNLTSVMPPGRQPYHFTYNQRNEPEYTFLPIVGQAPNCTVYSYDLDRRLVRVSPPSGRGVSIHYDAAGRADSVITSSTVYNFSFNPATGQLASYGDGTTTYANTYKGSLLYSVGLSGPFSARLTSGYGAGFRVTAAHLFDGQSTYTLGLGYNNDSQVTGIGPLRLGYDPASGILSGTALGDGGSTVSLSILERSGFGEVKHLSYTRSGAALYGADFAYDKLGRITSMTQTLGGAAAPRQFFYDVAGRLRAVSDGVTTLSTYTYDTNGNRLSRWALGQAAESASYDGRDRLLSYGSATYAYDADGRLATRTESGLSTVYGYDGLGDLKQVDLPDGRKIEYVLGPAGERLGRKVNGVWTHRFVYGAGLAPVAELDDAGRLRKRFVYATRGHVPDTMITYNSGAQTGVYQLICDQTGSVRLVVNVATGSIAQRLDYDEFGRLLSDTSPGFQPFGFAGGLWDADTGLVHMGAREYDPQTGRFTSLDPAGFGGGLNLYGYCLSDPINLIDPEGLGPDAWNLTKAFASGAYGGYCGFIDAFLPGQWTDPDDPYQQYGQRVGERTLFVESFLPLFFAPAGGGLVLYARGAPAAATVAKNAAAAREASLARYNDLVEQARQVYPKLAGKIHDHHIQPKYLGGPQSGETVAIDAAYHQKITNEFRSQWEYGQGEKPDPQRLADIMRDVYTKYPLPPL